MASNQLLLLPEDDPERDEPEFMALPAPTAPM
jgi:hypothetical protein